jgi:putative transposase
VYERISSLPENIWNVLEPKKSSNEFIAWESELSGYTLWMDGGYRGEDFMHWLMDIFQWIVDIVKRPLESKGFVRLPKRPCRRENIMLMLNWCRRLSKDYERLPETSETFIYIALIRIMVRRLA